jgi:hypothetical protein
MTRTGAMEKRENSNSNVKFRSVIIFCAIALAAAAGRPAALDQRQGLRSSQEFAKA